jgi:hypothetical protein
LPLPLLLSDEQRRRKTTNEHVHDRVENEAQKRLEVFNANSDDAEKEPRPYHDRSERDESESEENGLNAVQQEGEDVFHDEEVVFIYLVRRRDQNFLFVVFYDFYCVCFWSAYFEFEPSLKRHKKRGACTNITPWRPLSPSI